jgi:hypothetical protein
MRPAERQLLSAAGLAPQKPAGQCGAGGAGGVPLIRLLAAPAALAAIYLHTAAAGGLIALMQWAPTVFTERLGCSAAAAGRLLALPPLCDIAGQFVVALLERRVIALRPGLAALGLRRTSVTAGCLGRGPYCHSSSPHSRLHKESISQVSKMPVHNDSTALSLGCLLGAGCLGVFSVASTPWTATAAYCVYTGIAQNFLFSAFLSNYLEIGGVDVSVLSGVGNMVANSPGVVLPVLGLALRRRFGGSFVPIFGAVAAFQCSALLLFWRCGSTRAISAPRGAAAAPKGAAAEQPAEKGSIATRQNQPAAVEIPGEASARQNVQSSTRSRQSAQSSASGQSLSTHGSLGSTYTVTIDDGTAVTIVDGATAAAAAGVSDDSVDGWTGGLIWMSSAELATFMVGKGRAYWAGKRVVELGSGCGVNGIVAAALGAREVLLSDQSIAAAAHNVRRNLGDAVHVRVERLRWGDPADIARARPPYDVLLGADVVQEGGAIIGDYQILGVIARGWV